MTQEIIYKSFKDSSRNEILTLSLNITFEYVIYDGGAVVYPSATNIAFIVNFPSILMSNIMCKFMCSYPVLILHSSFHWVQRRQVSQIIYGFLPYLLKFPWSKSQSPIDCQYHMPILLHSVLVSQTYVMCANARILPWKNPISMVQSLLKPPSEVRLSTYFIHHSIFRHFKWVGLFKVLLWNPINWEVLPFHLESPTEKFPLLV